MGGGAGRYCDMRYGWSARVMRAEDCVMVRGTLRSGASLACPALRFVPFFCPQNLEG